MPDAPPDTALAASEKDQTPVSRYPDECTRRFDQQFAETPEQRNERRRAYSSLCLEAPRRSLAQYRFDLIARRLDLTRQQLAAKNTVAALGREIEQVTNRLRAIEAAGAT